MGAATSKHRDSQGKKTFESDLNNASPPPYDELPPKQREPTLKKTSDALPRPYDEHPTKTGVKASDTPKWTWNNAQCRDWIMLILEKGGKDRSTAETFAKLFEGSGPNLCMNDFDWWVDRFGPNGSIMHYSLVGYSKDEVPKRFYNAIGHLNNPKYYDTKREIERREGRALGSWRTDVPPWIAGSLEKYN